MRPQVLNNANSHYPPSSVLNDDYEKISKLQATDDDEEDMFTDAQSDLNQLDPAANVSCTKWGRAVLPAPMAPGSDYSVWSILKHCIGKELSKITMPVIFNEPLSLLQRLAETLQYCDLLTKADECDDPAKRIEYVATFATAAVSYNWERLKKSFNPLLGETYEFIRDDLGFRLVFEQVSHHPPISAFHAESPHFIFYGSMRPKLNFNIVARSVDFKPEGTLTVELLRHDEVYTWSAVNCRIHNIIVGRLWMEQCGTMHLKCHQNGYSASLNFKPAGWFSHDSNHVEGYVYDSQMNKLRFLYGKWCSYIRSTAVQHTEDYTTSRQKTTSEPTLNSMLNLKNSSNVYVSLDRSEKNEHNETNPSLSEVSELVWEIEPRPVFSARYYNFTFFTMVLNELTRGMERDLPPTDSRLRPDVRRLEEGDTDGAAEEKHRLEEKQRATRNLRKKRHVEWEPLWFRNQRHKYTQEDTWLYRGGYWERNYENCPDIY